MHTTTGVQWGIAFCVSMMLAWSTAVASADALDGAMLQELRYQTALLKQQTVLLKQQNALLVEVVSLLLRGEADSRAQQPAREEYWQPGRTEGQPTEGLREFPRFFR